MWSRSREVLSLAAGVAGHELARSMRAKLTRSTEQLAKVDVAARVAQATLLAESLGRLKGAFMKAGQLLSIDASDILPPEAQRVLASLQGEAEPVPFSEVRAVLSEDLGDDKVAMLESLEERAAACASIGQVHRAVVHGIPVALKVQHRGIRETIDADLELVHKVAKGWLSVSRRPIDLRATFEELSRILHLEADYERERVFLERFGELLGGDARFVVPQSFPMLSSSRVLTMTWEDGVTLGAWARRSPPREERQRLATSLLDLYCKEFFEWGLVQTDPNFGNFLVRDGAREIVLLDFGATVVYDPAFRGRYVELLRAMSGGSEAEMVAAGIANGLLDAREDEETRALFASMMRVSLEPFHAARQPFSFADADYAARSRDVVLRFTERLRFSPPPRDLLFLHRKLGGLFQLLKRLEVTLDLTPYWERMVVGGRQLGASSSAAASPLVNASSTRSPRQ